jgi:KDO2-lipid IV(A) lauroyltransferase
MGVRLETLMGSRAAVGLAVGAGRTLPESMALRLAHAIAGAASSRRDSALVRAIRLNQWVISGRTLDGAGLDGMVRAVLDNAARAQYELYRHYRDEEALLALTDVHPSMQRMLEHAASRDEGTIIVGPHVGNFDMSIHALGYRGLRAQVLSLPQPGGGYRWQNEQREHAGLDLTPVSKEALSAAVRRLREGGAVGTGVDRPIDARKYLPRFFGIPAPLPVVHVRLALKTGSPVFVVAAHRQADGRLVLHSSDPIRLEDTGDHMTDTLTGAERVLREAEDHILEAPAQWLMFYPVWPDLEAEVP